MLRKMEEDFPGSTVDENPPVNAGDMGSIPGPGRSHGRDSAGTDHVADQVQITGLSMH